MAAIKGAEWLSNLRYWKQELKQLHLATHTNLLLWARGYIVSTTLLLWAWRFTTGVREEIKGFKKRSELLRQKRVSGAFV